jgi:hypothetical protein
VGPPPPPSCIIVLTIKTERPQQLCSMVLHNKHNFAFVLLYQQLHTLKIL